MFPKETILWLSRPSALFLDLLPSSWSFSECVRGYDRSRLDLAGMMA